MNDYEQTRLQPGRAFDRAALAAIYDDYHQPIYRYIYRQIGEVEAARDLAAEVFHRLLKALQQGGGPDQKLQAWLYRTAHNAVIDFYRRQQHRRHLPLHETLVNTADDPVRWAERRLLAAEVRTALQQLTPDQQQVIALKFFAELSNEETAVVLDKPVGAVKSLQHRALAALQRQLAAAQETVLR
ncbi:MAG: sigma-70 family RNA polymerase sigma factor [Chloroflexota bacterium]